MIFVVAVVWLLRRLSGLQNLVTVCAWSRTVEDEGEWLSFEQYLLKRFNLGTSHGISPAEAEKILSKVNQPVQGAQRLSLDFATKDTEGTKDTKEMPFKAQPTQAIWAKVVMSNASGRSVIGGLGVRTKE